MEAATTSSAAVFPLPDSAVIAGGKKPVCPSPFGLSSGDAGLLCNRLFSGKTLIHASLMALPAHGFWLPQIRS